jgi:hypothetical protein
VRRLAEMLGSHIDTPEWQSFERHMRARHLARRRRRRLRWAIVIVAAAVTGVTLAPPRVQRQPTSELHKVEHPDALVVSLERRDSTVTVLRLPFAPTILTEQTIAAAAPPPSPALTLPPSEPEVEPAPAPAPRSTPTTIPTPPISAPPVAPPVETLAASPLPAPVGTTATNPPPIAVNVEQDVRNVIDRYRDAYERLDAAAARAVWPGVDEAGLTRAFGGLTSQRIEFARCDIWRDAQAAFATCSGTASYAPKVGRAQNDVPRSWHFRFRRRAAGWTIESAEVR